MSPNDLQQLSFDAGHAWISFKRPNQGIKAMLMPLMENPAVAGVAEGLRF